MSTITFPIARFLLVLIAVLLPGTVMADDAPAAPAEAGTRADAQQFSKDGMTAMREANTDPSRAIDAAILFNKALVIYQALGDTDGICDMQADIYWCKKHMDANELASYLAKKEQKGDTQARSAVEHLAVVTDAVVAPDQAETYFKRAQRFATDHPDQNLQIAMHYFEVADRFQGTPFSLEAQRLSLQAEQQFLSSLPTSQGEATTTLFSAPPQVPGVRQPIPAEQALHAAEASLRSTYRDELASTSRKALRTLLAHLIHEAQQPADSAARYALLMEAQTLAIKLNDPLELLAAIDERCADFQGIEAGPTKRQALDRMRLPAAHAMVTLVDKPDDALANTMVGRYFAFQAQKWDIALPFLVRSTDTKLRKVAQMELAKPATPQQIAEVGDSWYEISKHLSDSERDGGYARTLFWYQQVKDGLEGITKDIVARRITEIMGLILQEGITDWDHLTPAQWARIRSPTIEVEMIRPRNEVPDSILPDPPYRILPSPAETWDLMSADGVDTVDYHGDPKATIGGLQAGQMAMMLGMGKPQALAVVEKPQHLILAAVVSPLLGRGGRRGGGGGGGGGPVFNANAGSIHVKFMAIDQP